MTYLSLRARGLNGEIPRELGGLSGLLALWVHDNDLTGVIPPELGGLSNLIWMAVSGNGLTGEIPRELGGLSNLSQLWLQENRLSGEIPSELGDLTSLIILQMNDNGLSGPIPPELGSLTSVSTLNLSDNPLEGCLPPSWRSVGHNDFSDLGLPYCEESGRVAAPGSVSASVSGGTFTVTWDAVTGAGLYEVQYLPDGSGDDWSVAATSTAADLTYDPVDGIVCETTYRFRVRASRAPRQAVTIGRASGSSVDEGDDVNFTVRRNRTTSCRLDVNVEVSEDETEGSSFIRGTPPSEVTIPANDNEETFRVRTIDDDIDEVDGEVIATVQPGTGYIVGRPSSDDVYVDDNDATPTVSFSSSSYSVTEGSDRRIYVELSGASSRRLTIPITVSAGRAESLDYSVSGLSGGSLTFNAGETSKRLTIETEEDTGAADETVDIEVGSLPSGVDEGTPSSATLTILDDEDKTVTFSSASYRVDEGEDRNVTVRLSGESSQTLDIPITVASGSAENTDYRVTGLTGGKLRFSAWATSRTLTIVTNEDADECDDETVDLDFGSLPSGVDEGTSSSATVTIDDDDPCAITVSGRQGNFYAEGATSTVATYRADPSSVTWSLAGVDADFFKINSSGELRFKDTPDYDARLDDGNNNIYDVTIRATKSGFTTGTLDVDVRVNNESPTIDSGLDSVDYAEGRTDLVGRYRASDPGGGTITWSLHGDDLGDFDISDSGILTFEDTPDYEDPQDDNEDNEYLVTVRASDSSGGTADRHVTVTVENVDEPGTVTLSTTTPTVGTGVTASLSDLDGGVTNQSWQWQRSSNGVSWSNISGATVNSYNPESTDVGKRLMARATYHDVHGTGKSATSAATSAVTRPKLDKPDGFSLNPLSKGRARGTRYATLSWTGDDNATGYRVEITPSDEPWSSSITVTTTESVFDVKLDDVLRGCGEDMQGNPIGTGICMKLSDAPYEYKIRMKATSAGDAYADSDYSETITITNSPVIAVDGDSRDTFDEDGNAVGKAKITWQPVMAATGYEIRMVKLSNEQDHKAVAWSITSISDDQWTSMSLGKSKTSHTEEGLDLYEIYAIQLNYTTADGPVFSAQEFYVWPSDRPAGNGEVIATYPLRKYLRISQNRAHYNYYICDESFPGDQTRRKDWKNLINNAFERWETTTNGLVQISQQAVPQSETTGICYDFRELVDEVIAHDDLKGIDPDNTREIETAVGKILSGLQNAGVIRQLQEQESMVNEV